MGHGGRFAGSELMGKPEVRMAEKEEKQAQAAPEPVAGKPLFPKLVGLWVLLMAGSWGASLHWLLVIGGVGGGSRAVAGACGVALAVGIAALVVKKFGRAFAYVKPGQARGVRLTAAVSIGAMGLFAAYTLYLWPSASSPWWADLWRTEFIGKVVSVKPVLFPAAALFTAVVLVTYLLLNKEKWAEFLIETEGEMKKVSWPHRKDYVGSAMVVVFVVVVISSFLFFVDRGLSWLSARIGIGF